MQTRRLAALEPIHSLESPAFYVSYPRLVGRDAMPEDVFNLSDRRWRQEYFPASPVKLYRLTDVIVAEEGLVFDNARNLYAETRKVHSDKNISSAVEASKSAGGEGPPMARYSRAVLCKQSGSNNFGHWLTEMLPKAFFAQKELGLRGYLYAIPKVSGQLDEVVRESLEMIGISRDNQLPLGRAPVIFDELIVVEGLTTHSAYMSPLVFECLRHLSEDIAGHGVERVYLRRWPAQARDFENEELIAECLSKEGFQSFVTSALSFRDQIAMIKDARVVLGTMGAAMTNVAFCKPGTQICLFGPASAREFFYWFLCNLKHLDYYEVRCPELGPGLGPLPWDRRISCSPQEMSKFLARLWT